MSASGLPPCAVADEGSEAAVYASGLPPCAVADEGSEAAYDAGFDDALAPAEAPAAVAEAPAAVAPTISPAPPAHAAGARVFVGGLPAVCTAADLDAVFSPYGGVEEVHFVLDKVTGMPRGCAFMRLKSREDADAAIAALHNTVTLAGMASAMKVEYPRSETAAGASSTAAAAARSALRVYFSGAPSSATEADVRAAFETHGAVTEVKLLHHPDSGHSRGTGFITYTTRGEATAAIAAMRGAAGVFPGQTRPLTVDWPETAADKGSRHVAAGVGGGAARGAPGGVATGGRFSVMPAPGGGYMMDPRMLPQFAPPPYPYPPPPMHMHHMQQQQHPQQQQQFRAVAYPPPYGAALYPPPAPVAYYGGGGTVEQQLAALAAQQAHLLHVQQQQRIAGAAAAGGAAAGGGGFYGGAAVQRPYGASAAPAAPGPDAAGASGVAAAAGVAAGSRREGPPGANVFVHGVPVGCTDGDLVGLFSMYGPLLSARLATDKVSGAPRNFGFVAFERPADASAACAALHGSVLPNGSAPSKRLKVELRTTALAVA